MAASDFEKDLERLETIVSRLESGELKLEESLKFFEEGLKLSRLCQERLNAAEKRLKELLKSFEKEEKGSTTKSKYRKTAGPDEMETS